MDCNGLAGGEDGAARPTTIYKVVVRHHAGRCGRGRFATMRDGVKLIVEQRGASGSLVIHWAFHPNPFHSLLAVPLQLEDR